MNVAGEFLDFEGLQYFYQCLNEKLNDAGLSDLSDILPLFEGQKFAHSITIGDHVYNGAEDIIIDIYNGELSNEEISTTLTLIQQEVNTMQLNDSASNTMQLNDSASNTMQLNDSASNTMTMISTD